MTKPESELPLQVDYRVIFDTASNGMAFAYASTGRIIAVNETWLRSTGIARQDAIGKTANELGIWASANEREACIAELERSGQVLDHRVHLKTRGEEIPHLISGRIVDLNGERCVLWEFRDISMERKAHAALQSGAAWHRALLHNTVEGVCIFDEEMAVLEANERFAEMLGYTASEMRGMHPWDWDLNLSETDLRARFSSSQTNGFTTETRHRRKTGSSYDAEISIQHADIGDRKLAVTVVRDISERKLAEKRLRESEEKYRGIFDESVAAIYVFDNEKRFIDSNQAGLDLLGYSRDELLCMSIPDVDADPVAVLPAHQQLLDGRHLINYEHQLRRGDGAIISVLNNSRPLTDQRGNVVGMQSTLIDVTEGKDVQKRLEDSEQRLRLAMGAARMGVWEFNFADNRLYWSPEIYSIFGFPPIEPSRALVQSFEHQDDKGVSDAEMQRAIANRTPYFAQYRIILKGETKWVEDRGTIDYSEDGQPKRVIGLAQDITERKEIERKLQDAYRGLENERGLLKTLVQTIPDLVWLKDTEGVYLACNPEFERFFGHPEKEIVGKTDYDFISGDLAEFFRGHDRAAMAAGKPTINEEWISYASDGHRALLVTTKTPMHGADGSVIGVLGIAHDITELRANQEELERHRRDLERLVEERTAELMSAHQTMLDTQFAMDKVGIGITWVDARTGRFLYVNDYHAKLLGYTQDEMLQMGVPDIDPDFPATAFARAVDEVRAKGVIQFESAQRTKNGKVIPAEMTLYYHPGTGETGARLIAFMTDITRRKESENNLLAAKKAAEAATVAKSAFLANMSHEIRTPLNAITGMAHLMRRSGISLEQGGRLDKIERAGGHLLETINAILDLSKIEAGKFVLEEAEVDLGAIVENVTSILRHQAQSKSLEIVVDNQLTETKYLGDATRLQQGLLNYGSNALKFTEHGAIVLRVVLAQGDRETALVHFEVEDQGVGIDAEKLPKLFSAFEQADNSTTRKYGGTGLGLAITKKLAQLMGGDAGASSKLGKGSLFWFTARLKRTTELVRAAAPIPNMPAEALLARDYRGARLLLVEDEPVNREVALMLLNEIWPSVDVAADGEIAVELASKNSYDLILMDMQMPNMDGLDATRCIRQLPLRPRVPVVAMTANAFSEDRQRCFAAGMNDFLSKPVAPEALFEVILKWLRK